MSNGHISHREHEILIEAASGLTDKEICAKLGITTSTISTYWTRIREKTGCVNRAEALVKVLGEECRNAMNEAIQAREDLDLLLDQAEGYAVFSISPEGKLLNWNRGVERVLGFSADEFVGKDYAIVFTPDDAEAGEPQIELEQATQHGRCLETRYHIRRDGSHVWIDGTLVAMLDAGGRVRRFAKIMRDDTPRKALEEEVQRLQARGR
jgi:PAS domain S-box-containing protein